MQTVPTTQIFSFAPLRDRAVLRGFFLRGVVMALAFLLAASFWGGAAWAVDVNQATQEQLQAINGIGPKTAQSIIEERERAGRFASFADLSERVKGIGSKRAQALQAAGLEISTAQTGTPSASASAPTPPLSPTRAN